MEVFSLWRETVWKSPFIDFTLKYPNIWSNNSNSSFQCFDPEVQINPNYVLPELYTNPELEQITTFLLLGHDVMKTCGLLIGKQYSS